MQFPLIVTRTTVNIINAEFCQQLGSEIDQLISVSATGGTTISYLGYTEVLEHSQLLSRSCDVSDF